MAELIPLEYRIRTVSRQRLERWVLGCILVVAALSAVLLYTYAWDRRTGADLEKLRAEYRDRNVLIVKSQALRQQRVNLADRMGKIQQLMDDRTLLSLLRSVAESFSTNDALEYIHIDARGLPQNASQPAPEWDSNAFSVRITGITTNSTTLAELMTRLSKNNQPQLNVTLQSSHRETFMDGQVMRFQILCDRPPTAIASNNGPNKG